MKTIFIFANVIFSVIAACLWIYACIVNVEPDESDLGAKTILISDDGKRTDFYKTAEQQIRWNKYAALATAMAVIFQALSAVSND